MITRMALIKAKAGMTREAFKEYYENTHVPLSTRMYPMIAEYRRNYIEREDARMPQGATELPFDVIVEHRFATEADHRAFLEKRTRPEVRAELRADGLNFMEMEKLFAFLVTVEGR